MEKFLAFGFIFAICVGTFVIEGIGFERGYNTAQEKIDLLNAQLDSFKSVPKKKKSLHGQVKR